MTSSDKPGCFGTFDKVFPMGKDGLRSVNPDCDECEFVHPCLKEGANSSAGLEMRAERMEAMDRTGSGLLGFLNRWSELKSMRRGKSEK